jgi:hypothetical protein
LTSDTRVELLLDGYIHRWARLHDGWKGTGSSQRVRIVVSGPAAVPAAPRLPVDIAVGRLQLDAGTSDAIVGLPFQASGSIRLWLQLITADVFDVTGSSVRIDATARARYIEDLPPDLTGPWRR